MKNILITGGIGDVFALDSFMSDEEKASINGIYLATRPWKEISDLFSYSNRKYKNLKFLKPIYDKWDFHRRAIYHKNELNELCDKLPDDWETVEDYSILIKFYQYKERNYKPYYSSSWFNNKDVVFRDRFKLPKNYIVIVPSSGNFYSDRDLKIFEWTKIVEFLHKNKLYGLILKSHKDEVPKHKKLIDLTNQTSLYESIRILENSKGYIGIDSCLSVFASKKKFLFKSKIKSINPHLYNWEDIYYAPRNDFYDLDRYINIE